MSNKEKILNVLLRGNEFTLIKKIMSYLICKECNMEECICDEKCNLCNSFQSDVFYCEICKNNICDDCGYPFECPGCERIGLFIQCTFCANPVGNNIYCEECINKY